MDRAIAAARNAFDDGPWPRLSHGERAEYLRALGKELAARGDALGDIWPRESGDPRDHGEVRRAGLRDGVRLLRRPR